MLKRIYKAHLKNVHKEEDTQNRGLDQPTLQQKQKQCASGRDDLSGSIDQQIINQYPKYNHDM